MIRLKISYDTEQEKDKIIRFLRRNFRFKREPKVYKKEGPNKRIYLDLLDK